MGKSVREAQASIDSREYAEWLAWHSIEPFTIDRTEAMLAQVCAVLMNVNRTKPSDKIFDIEDFLMWGKPTKKRNTALEIETKLKAIFSGYNK